MGSNRNHQAIDEVQRLNENVQMSVRHRIERARIKSGRHENPCFGFARLLSWKPAYRKPEASGVSSRVHEPSPRPGR